MSSQLTSLAAWWFLPTAVGYLQTFLYSLLIRAGDPHPAPGSPRWVRHRRLIHLSLILAYFLYCIYEADWQIQRQGDYYRLLGVPLDIDERALQSRFRRLTVLYHPDKLSPTHPDPSGANAYYAALLSAKTILLDPAARFAYDRLGPSFLDACPPTRCATARAHILLALQQTATSYALTLALLFLLQHILPTLPRRGRAWRYLATLSLFLIEVSVLTRGPQHPWVLRALVNPALTALGHPPLLPWQALRVLRAAVLAGGVGGMHAAALLWPGTAGDDEPEQVQRFLDRLQRVVGAADGEAGRLVGLEGAPFVDDGEDDEGDKGEGAKRLREAVRGWLVQNAVRSERGVREAIERALGGRRRSRRVGAPVGARGTK